MKRTLTLIVFVLFSLLASGCATASTSGVYTLRGGNTLGGGPLYYLRPSQPRGRLTCEWLCHYVQRGSKCRWGD